MASSDAGQSEWAHRRVQAVLRAGLALSVAATLGGFVTCLATRRLDARAVSLADVARPMDPGLRLVMFGILALALTPAFRVGALVLIWARERDWRFVALAVAVTCVLTASALLGAG